MELIRPTSLLIALQSEMCRTLGLEIHETLIVPRVVPNTKKGGECWRGKLTKNMIFGVKMIKLSAENLFSALYKYGHQLGIFQKCITDLSFFFVKIYIKITLLTTMR